MKSMQGQLQNLFPYVLTAQNESLARERAEAQARAKANVATEEERLLHLREQARRFGYGNTAVQ